MKTIESVQKIIKVGDSLAVTIPAKDARALGFSAGDSVRSRIEGMEAAQAKIGIAQEYDAFAKQYNAALKSLSGR